MFTEQQTLFPFPTNRYGHSSFSVLNCILSRHSQCMAILYPHSTCPPFLVAPTDFKMSIGPSSQILACQLEKAINQHALPTILQMMQLGLSF